MLRSLLLSSLCASLSWSGWAHATATPADPPDVVFLHGRIHTQDPQRTVVEALAVRGNRIVAAGTDREIGALRGPVTRSVDLRHRVMLPGIIDAHVHPAMSAQMLDKCNLEDKPVLPARIKAQIAACLRNKPGDRARWYEVVMVNPTGNTLVAADLDALSAVRPLMLEGSDGHTIWLNSAALAAAHITRETADPAGGKIEHDAAGAPTGVLRDNATLLALEAAPAATADYETKLLDRALHDMRATGITSVQDAAVDEHLMVLYKRLYDRHALDMRVRGSFHLKDLNAPPADVVAQATAFRTRWAVDPDFLRADAVKIFADGVIESPSQTAALLTPYLAADGTPTHNAGPSYFTQPGLDQIVTGADAAGLTVHIHAIGDRAVRSSLDAFEAARKANGARDDRPQIAHLELIDPQDFPRFKSLGVIANFQLLWAERGDYIDAGTIRYLGPQRSKYLYPARSLQDAGALIAGGSDWGVSSFNAFIAMEHGITRSERRGDAPLLPEQALSLQTMVDAYTINAAFALKQEKTTGSLEVGKLADFIVLDRDIFALDPFDLHATRVLSTYLDGREVYRAPTRPKGT